jgi:asparagine synthase (glutamine-hydrolysing)
LARKHVTVALSGDGGDENFIGYRRYRYFAAEERLRSAVPQGLRQGLFGPLGSAYPKLDWAPRFLRAKTTFQALARCSAEAYLHGVSIIPSDVRSRLYSPGFTDRLQGYCSSQVFARHLHDKEFSDSLRMVQYLDFKTYLPGDILTKVDRASMAHSLEVRVPFLDYQFVEWAAGVPTSMKLRGGEGKYILKKGLEPHLPHEVLYRDKMGFAVPLDIWFRESLSERMAAAVTGQRLKDSGYLDAAALDGMVADHRSGRRNFSAALWSLLMFDGFLRSLEA